MTGQVTATLNFPKLALSLFVHAGKTMSNCHVRYRLGFATTPRRSTTPIMIEWR